MRSVIYQFTEDELANIRVQSMNDDYFYQSILHYMKDQEANPLLVEKLEHFMDDINMYQEYSQSHPVYQPLISFIMIITLFNILVVLLVVKVDARIYMDCLIKQ